MLNNNKIFFVFFAALFIFKMLAIFPPHLLAESKIKSIAVFPFEVISKEESSFIGRGMGKMLCSRISSNNITKVKCMDRFPAEYGLDPNSPSLFQKISLVPELNGVDFILTGTVTIAGESVSSDAKLIDMLNPEDIKFISTSGKSVDEIINHASAIAEKVKSAIHGNIDGGGSIIESSNIKDADLNNKSTPVMGGAENNNNVNKTKLQNYNSDLEKKSSGTGIFLDAADRSILMNCKLNKEIRGIAAADIEGDGNLDIVVMDDHSISFFGFANNTLIKKGGYESEYYNQNISIDALDLNKNGKSELFVSAVGKNNYLKSYIIEWNGNQFQPIIKDAEWYFRVINYINMDNGRNYNHSRKYSGNLTLIGQKRGHDEIFLNGVYSLDLKGSKIIKQEKIFDNHIDIFGSTPLTLSINNNTVNNNKSTQNSDNYTLWFDRSGFLNLSDSKGIKEWQSSESFGSTALFIEEDKGKDNLKERIYINNRLLAEDINNDGSVEIITAVNADAAKGYLSGYRKLGQGYIKAVVWKNGTMVDVWKNNPAGGYISDFTVLDVDGDSYPEIIYSVVTNTGLLMNKMNSSIFIEKMVEYQK